MQTSAPELMDLSGESKETLDLYGAKPGEASFANNCLLARRLVERGVRFVNLYHEGWDHHSDVAGGLKTQCGQTDRASAALVIDLKRRGLLDDTLVVWGGEFGRTPMVESNAALGRSLGRDHHPQAFTMWMAGGGIKPGITLGATDDLGFHVTEDPVHVHDIQATILHLLGLDHTRLTYKSQGRDFRLTDVSGDGRRQAPRLKARPTMSRNELAGKVALVTGASRGLGAAIAPSLGRRGARVAVNTFGSPEKAQAVADAIRPDGGEAEVFKADVRDEAEVKAMVARDRGKRSARSTSWSATPPAPSRSSRSRT